MNSLQDMFANIQAKEKTRIENSGKSSKGDKDNPHMLHMEEGNTYVVRVLYTPGPKRTVPFIDRYQHTYWDADSKTFGQITCPTSEYISDMNGFDECDVCTETSKLFNEWKDTGSVSARDIYDKFKRKFEGYALVYVVNDPTNSDNNNTIKIWAYKKTPYKFLKLKIFSIDVEAKKEIEGAGIGMEAFQLKQGRNIKIVTTGESFSIGTRNIPYIGYNCEFDYNLSDLDITEEEVAKASKDLKFDENYYTFSTPEEISAFYKKFMLKEDTVDGEVDGIIDELETLEEDGVVVDDTKPEPEAKKEEPKAEVKKEVKPEVKKTEVDIQAILNRVNKDHDK